MRRNDAIKKLAREIFEHSRHFEYPSPSSLFTAVWGRHVLVADTRNTGRVFEDIKREGNDFALGADDMALLGNWTERAVNLCRRREEAQRLYRMLVKYRLVG